MKETDEKDYEEMKKKFELKFGIDFHTLKPIEKEQSSQIVIKNLK